MNINFTLNRFFYFLSNDPKVEQIERILNCRIVNGKGRYYGKYISYLAFDSVNRDKITELEHALKKHVEVVKKDYNFIIKVYHYPLVKYCEYQFNQTKDLVLGIGYNGLVRIPMNTESNNYLICGCSGSGKSTLAISIIKNLIDNHVDVVIVDNKSSFDYNGLDCPLFKGINACLDQLYKFNHEIDTLLSEGKTHKKLLVIDEIFPFLLLSSKEKKEAYNLLALIMSKCRAVDYHIMILTQRATTDIIDAKILTHCSYRVCLTSSSKQESINVLNCDIAYDISIKGRGYLSVNGRLTEFQSYYYKQPKQDKKTTDDDITNIKNVEYNDCKEEIKEGITNKFL